jgi:hypothetical protein
VTLSTPTNFPASDQLQITVTPDYANGTYTVRDGSRILAFTLPDPVAAPNPNIRMVSLTDGEGNSLALFNNLATGSGTNDPFLQLHYLSFAFLYENDSATDTHRTTAMMFGTPTLLADLPRSGTATYTTQGFASARVDFPTYAKVQGRLTADFASGAIGNSFAIYYDDSASVFPTYRISGSGTITSGSSAFSGTLTGTTVPLTGTFTGGLFGPGAAEAGFTFALTGTMADGRQQRVVGAAGGAR